MKTGLENKRNVAILSVLLVVVAGCLVYFFESMFGGSSPAPAAVVTQHTPVTAARNNSGPAAKKLPSLENLDPTLHPEWMAQAESLKYTGDGRNIFSMSSVPTKKIEQVHGPVRPSASQVIAKGPTGPPPPPPIDLTFFGYASANGVKKAFLLHGEDVFIAKEGEVVDHHYKVVRINPLSIEVMDLLYNNTQTLPLVKS